MDGGTSTAKANNLT